MAEDDKALVKGLREEADEWDEPKSEDEVDMRGMLHRAADRIEALSAENERLREALEIIATDGLHTPSKNVSLARAALGETK